MELRPFRSIRFSPRVLRERGLSNVFAPPYDQISPERQDQLYARAPENIVRVTYPKKEGEDPYAGAAKTLADWLAAGILEKERRPALWTYRQTFTEDGKTIVRDALVGLVRLEEYDARDDPSARAHAREAQGGPSRAALGHEGGPRAALSADERSAHGGSLDAARAAV